MQLPPTLGNQFRQCLPVRLLAEAVRLVVYGLLQHRQVVLEKRMEANQAHALHSSHALQTMADGLPALGIVAAVLGVIAGTGFNFLLSRGLVFR